MDMADEQKGTGITITEWGAGAVRPVADKTSGTIMVKGKATNSAPILMVGVITVKATKDTKTVTGQQRFFCLGQFARGVTGMKSKDFEIAIPVDDIGAVGAVWKVTLQTANGLGLMNTQFKKEFELTVREMMVVPDIIIVHPPGGGPGAGGAGT